MEQSNDQKGGRRAYLFISISRSSYDRNFEIFSRTMAMFSLIALLVVSGLELRENWFCIIIALQGHYCTLLSLFGFPFTGNCPSDVCDS